MNYVVPIKTIPVKDQQSYSILRKFCNFCKACNFSYIVIASSTYLGFRTTFQIRWIIESIYTLSLLYSLSTYMSINFSVAQTLTKYFSRMKDKINCNYKINYNFNCLTSLSIASKIL